MNIAIVVSEFNEEVTFRMLSVAEEKAKKMKLKINYTCKVPGAFDMPIVIDVLLQKKDVDGVVTLGAIIKGQTKHDEVIAHSTANALTALSIKYQKPVSLGITGPGMQDRHAYARIRPVAERAVESVVKIFNELKRIQK
ncbi:MAG: 6,7-dimethyl-8-ribityllumazine synthase [Nitrosarchaeum sp.]|nr:6,7-dimethyl-8-ribityllumazine synthase [Nitrosarchaeum sp.]